MFDKLKFWKKHEDPYAFEDPLGSPTPDPLDNSMHDPLGNQYGETNEPLPPLDPLQTNTDPLTPSMTGKYDEHVDPMATPAQGQTPAQSNPNVDFYEGGRSTKEWSDQLGDKYKAEFDAKQNPNQQPQQAPQGQSLSNRDLEVLNLKIDAVKSEVSSLGHQLDKIEGLIKDQKKAW